MKPELYMDDEGTVSITVDEDRVMIRTGPPEAPRYECITAKDAEILRRLLNQMADPTYPAIEPSHLRPVPYEGRKGCRGWRWVPGLAT
jgi:hypothetical protein